MLRKIMIVLAAALAIGTTAVSTSAFAHGGGPRIFHSGGGGHFGGGHFGGGHFGGGHFDGGHFGHGHFGHGFHHHFDGFIGVPYGVWPYANYYDDQCYYQPRPYHTSVYVCP